ncbi:rhomboid-like protein 19 [Senna tora]|uniref:Rhomboid-like protein 19 n=1 Tax=Senna tora TaxID=362788 RepID=A0A834SXA3_9FABA|nr:rhomboid-like protein 19 [Senna tora]
MLLRSLLPSSSEGLSELSSLLEAIGRRRHYHPKSQLQLSPSMSTPVLSGGTNLFSGFTRLCKGLAAVLIGSHIVIQFFPSAITYLALIPARTIPFAWNLITAGYIEQSIHGVVVSTIALLFIGKLLEPVWGPREFLKFIFVVNFLTSVCIFITAIALYYITSLETYLYMPLSGFHGIIMGFLVGIKQIIPDQELPFLKLKAKWLPSITLLLSIAISFWTLELTTYVPTVIFGTYLSWIYLRYWQRKPETKLKGDPSDDFAFSTFFPEFLRPLIDPIASIFHRMLCGRSEASNSTQGYTLGSEPLPGSDPIEASRRRERGARALEERLAAERLAAIRSSGEPPSDAAENV